MANKSELEKLAHEAVRLQAQHAQRKAKAFLDLLTKDTSNARPDGLTQRQRELIDEFQRDFGMSADEAREHLRLLGG